MKTITTGETTDTAAQQGTDLALVAAEQRDIAAAEAGGDDTVAGDGEDTVTAAGGDDDSLDHGGDDAPAPTKSRRELALEKIAQRQEEDHKKETGEHQRIAPKSGEETADEPGTVAIAAAAKGDYPLETGADGVLYAVLNVEGQSVKKPLKDVIAIAQKDAAGDQRLKRASETMKQVARINQSIAEREAALDARIARLTEAGTKISSGQPSVQDVGKLKTASKALFDAIYDEDTDKATEHLEVLLAGRGDSTQEQDQVRSTVQELITERQQLERSKTDRIQIEATVQEALTEEWTEARTTFMQEFPEIKPGSEAWKQASALCGQLQKDPAFNDASYLTIFREAGSRVRKVASDLAPQTIQDRTQRKLQSQHVSSRASVTQTQKRPEEPKRQSMSEQIAAMRRNRRPYLNY